MVVAFIPVRGGSKSIPLKNIKPFYGKPLVCWTIEALERCATVDRVVIATDSMQIEAVVAGEGYSKTEVYRRLSDNACDTSSTESVMLEYLERVSLDPRDTFVLVQATSPLTQERDFTEALEIYSQGTYDSMLTCVRSRRFFWSADGTSKNYDYRARPRRQDFEGELMENGAFYINSVAGIVESSNRLSGRIGIYEMAEYTAIEIDEPDDWQMLEGLMYRHVLRRQEMNFEMKKIRLVLSDVDGVLTDAGMYYSENGVELKKFNTHDGMGFNLLQQAGLKVGIVTSEQTQMVENRAKKLKLDYLYQGKRDGGKLAAAKEICSQMGISLDEVAYIGDDVNCYELLSAVGYAACPADALPKIKSIAGIDILRSKGGEGAFRELAEKILCANG
ncbi:MAG: N-acylneuraminate cytidylyltransferase [Rikenellaceae bacterium]